MHEIYKIILIMCMFSEEYNVQNIFYVFNIVTTHNIFIYVMSIFIYISLSNFSVHYIKTYKCNKSRALIKTIKLLR